MSNLKNLQMANAISSYPNITVQKSFFSTKVTYTPTGSRVEIIVREYTPDEGKRLLGLLSMSPAELSEALQKHGKPVAGSNGHYHLEACLSEDRQFCAVQVLRFGDFAYSPVGEPRFYEGDEAKLVAQVFC